MAICSAGAFLPAPQTQTVQQNYLTATLNTRLTLGLPALRADGHAQEDATPWVQLINIGLASGAWQHGPLLLPMLQRQILGATADLNGQLQGSARFGASTRQPLSTKGLHTNHCPHHIAVDVYITGVDARNNTLHGFVQTGVHTEGQTIATLIDLIN